MTEVVIELREGALLTVLLPSQMIKDALECFSFQLPTVVVAVIKIKGLFIEHLLCAG